MDDQVVTPTICPTDDVFPGVRDDEFREFVTASSPSLSRSAFLLTGDHHLAEDLLQSALANAYRHWSRVTSNPHAYVRRSMYHEHVSSYRRRRVREYPAESLPEPATTRDLAEETSEKVALVQALKRLSPRQRAIMVLRFYEDLTEAETARTLGCTLGTVKRHGHEALARLREVMHDQAAQAKSYDVHQRSIATAKRRDRIRLATATGVALVLVAMVMAGIGLVPAIKIMLPADPSPVSIPDRVVAPPRFYLQATKSPAGPAAVLIGGVEWGMPLESDGDLAVVGSTSDSYRTILDEGGPIAGRQALLSPDGRKVARHAYSDGDLRITDLTTGAEKTYFTDGYASGPAAWSRDGATLGVWVFQNPGGYLALLDLNTGQVRTIYQSAGDVYSGPGGWNMAFSPDGSRLAYTRDGEVVIIGMDLVEQSRFPLPAGAFLAGKGAWTPDGAGVAIVRPEGRGWRLDVFDLGTGTYRQQSWSAGREMAAMRLMGWSPAGEPVVTAYFAKPGPPSINALGNANSNKVLASAEVLALTPQGPRALITAPGQVKSIDLSEDAIASGRIRNASPPVIGPISGGIIILALALAAVIGWSIRRKHVRARRPSPRSGT